MAGPNDFQAIVTAILGYVTDDTTVVAMLCGAGLESDWRIDAPGGGAFQIIDSRPSPTTSLTSGNSQISADVKYMLPRYQAACTAHAAEPEGGDKYANIAHDAERPAAPYQQSQGEAKVNSVYQTVVTNYGKVGATGTAPVKTIVGGNIGLGFLGPVLDFLGDLTDIRLWRSLGWIAVGLLVFLLGLALWLKKELFPSPGSVLRGAE